MFLEDCLELLDCRAFVYIHICSDMVQRYAFKLKMPNKFEEFQIELLKITQVEMLFSIKMIILYPFLWNARYE